MTGGNPEEMLGRMVDDLESSSEMTAFRTTTIQGGRLTQLNENSRHLGMH